MPPENYEIPPAGIHHTDQGTEGIAADRAPVGVESEADLAAMEALFSGPAFHGHVVTAMLLQRAVEENEKLRSWLLAYVATLPRCLHYHFGPEPEQEMILCRKVALWKDGDPIACDEHGGPTNPWCRPLVEMTGAVELRALLDVRRLVAAKRARRPVADSFEVVAAALAASIGQPVPAPWGPLDEVRR